jgi:hypothetical protein
LTLPLVEVLAPELELLLVLRLTPELAGLPPVQALGLVAQAVPALVAVEVAEPELELADVLLPVTQFTRPWYAPASQFPAGAVLTPGVELLRLVSVGSVAAAVLPAVLVPLGVPGDGEPPLPKV